MKDLLRFDTIVAMCALLVSVITAGVLGYQTHVVEEQYAATIWPYLSIDTTNSQHQIKLAVTNNGLGPALIGSAQLLVDGRPALGWTTLTDQIKRDPAFRSLRPHKTFSNTTTSVDGSTTIRPGDSLALLTVTVPAEIPTSVLHKHQMSLKFCYCSLNDRCWNLATDIGSRKPDLRERVNSCPLSSTIQA